MKKKLRRYIGDRHFYKMLLAIVVPIIIQNGITNFVSLLDNLMVGRIGTEQMSGVAIVNQLIFVFNLCIFGAVKFLVPESLLHSFLDMAIMRVCEIRFVLNFSSASLFL